MALAVCDENGGIEVVREGVVEFIVLFGTHAGGDRGTVGIVVFGNILLAVLLPGQLFLIFQFILFL